MVGWHHRLNGQKFEQTQGDGEGQVSLACFRLFHVKLQRWEDSLGLVWHPWYQDIQHPRLISFHYVRLFWSKGDALTPEYSLQSNIGLGLRISQDSTIKQN